MSDSSPVSRVVVFCGSSHGSQTLYTDTARRLGELLAEGGHGLVYGGGDVGLMGVVAAAVLDAGGEVIGVIPRVLVEREVAHHGLTELHVVETMHQRKRKMYDLADVAVALPGGIGTLDELFETLTWNQLGYLRQPCGLLDVGGYWRPLIEMLDRMVTQGFLRPEARRLLQVDEDPGRLLGRLLEALPAGEKWRVGGPASGAQEAG